MSDPLGVIGVVLAEKFRVDRLLGEGGFGVVYAGMHTVLGEPIAVKFIKIDTQATDPARAAEEYLREARILFSLSHPAIVRMYDVGALERRAMRLPWVVLELLSGPTLEQEIEQRRQQGRHFSAGELREIFDPILDGLAFAHGRGIMHRDIKPSNILLSRAASGSLEPKLLDFGTARTQLSVFQTALGRTGFTPLYGAPEQWDPQIAPPSPATDVYAVGLTMLESATLQRPHGAADSLPGLLRAVMSGGARSRRLQDVRADLPPALGMILARTLAVVPAQRFRDASELRDAVRAALAPTSPGARTASPPAALAPYVASAPYAASAPPGAFAQPAAYRTTAPVVATQAPAAPPASGLGIAAVVIAAVALVAVLGMGVAGFLLFRGNASRSGPASPIATAPPGGRKPISAAQVGTSELFDRANAIAVMQKNQPAVDACGAKSHRFDGTIDIVLEVSVHDGRVIGAACQTVWPSYDSKHPRLDPEAADVCACLQAATASWKFTPPRQEIIFDDSQSLHVHYICSR
ncbi:MAG TPA: serine/threonine-protein kinase [Labilithrix sp.]|nr:serine/threonine-protein kinase [Labilithrix sp.]